LHEVAGCIVENGSIGRCDIGILLFGSVFAPTRLGPRGCCEWPTATFDATPLRSSQRTQI
jgi:hypothetical protein